MTGCSTGGAGSPVQSGCRWRIVEQVLGLYREQYFDLNVRHFHEKLREVHRIELSYTWVKAALQGRGAGQARAQARRASQAARAAAAAGHAAAHRRQPSSLVSGRALV